MNDSSRFTCVNGFGEELDELIYEGVSNWFITFRSPFTIYTSHFSLLLVFVSIVACGLLSYRHSIENGHKYTHFWWGALIHGVVSERGITATKYWHAQAPIMFMGKQLPLHIVFFYPSIIYVSMMAVQRLKLNVCTEPAAVGLIAMLMEIPFRMISVKFLHITYHDTDPLYYHKMCGVPWIEIFSSLVFASSYVATYHGINFYKYRDISAIWDNSKTDKKDSMMTALSGISGPIAAFFLKVFLFHILHDTFNVNPISCMFFAVCLYLSFILCFEPKKMEKHIIEDSNNKTFLFYQVCIFLTCLVFLALFGKPQNEISIGSHEPTGDCTTLICSRTPLGKQLKRKKYLCVDEVGARRNFVYNFECLEDGPPLQTAIWYTICGSPIPNRPQFIVNLFSFVLLIFSFFYKVLFTDVDKFEAAKRLIVKFGRAPSERGVQEAEISVGFVIVKQNSPFLTKMALNKKKFL